MPRWTARTMSQAKLMSRTENSGDWAIDTLEAAKENIEDRGYKTFGIRSPEPIGIVTFEDLIDTILQKTSRDEKDYFNHGSQLPLTKTKKLGDGAPNPTLANPQEVYSPKSKRTANKLQKFPAYNDESIPADRAPTSWRDSLLPTTVRRRNVSKNAQIAAVDGADDDHSSYTQNSRGGFHESGSSFENGMVLTQIDIAQLRSCSSSNVLGNPYSNIKTGACSLPFRKGDSSMASVGLTPTLRHVSAAPRIPNSLHRVTPFSRHNYSSYERMVDPAEGNGGLVTLTLPDVEAQDTTRDLTKDMDSPRNGDISYLVADNPDSILEDARESHRASSGETISLSTWYGELNLGEEVSGGIGKKPRSEASTQGERLFPSGGEETRLGSPVLYDGFPPELLDLEYNKDSRLPSHVSRTLPRMQGFGTSENEDSEPPSREKSFHDDRALLPSQCRALNSSTMNVGGARSSSLWF
jgi:metal transporter CNNM